ncbi:tryptophanyl-tRNA synthetase [Drepanopeziza brunnea f. sp. 'multigermtubi' MB_m1]|uniref:tryptophan--tRNA ligase n=1 Tax=Marssonina brunnea f. sp. multigermtubi (strain MB_m1) TaxID=1072389 RepID=K1XYT5_MARBU|nr:tryptophanyl-tRNA synthetase [Drepanopeziza brunnea f. sp. 'multigermtubi' MB_m1]EKD18004.1 tryptophanyl-tRNA synthetase [Drepanopeziza brunnea f. sp. 'multigermtubi' MB_m1]
MFALTKHTRLLEHPLRSLLIQANRPPLSASTLQRFSSTSSTSSTSTAASHFPTANPSPPQTIFSGIQPTGIPHLGNLLGALRTWVALQDAAAPSTKLLYSVVDLHAITLFQRPEELRRWRREALAALLAVGIREERCAVFMQSQVPAHSELMWILSCTASMGYLSRMTQWKSKLSLADNTSPLDESSKSKLKLGLFSYPVLQAADILVHRATHVPVGEDQSQHLEFARECVTNFNHTYGGSHLVAPQTILSPTKRIMSLSEPLKKMSKSAPSPLSRILITDSPSTISQKISSALTDSDNSVSYAPTERPGVSNLLTLLSSFDSEGRSPQVLGDKLEKEGMGLGAFKKLVAGAVSEGLSGVRGEFDRVLREDGYVEEVARRGAARAKESAEETMVLVRDAVGL